MWYFSVGGAKSIASIDKGGGQNPYFSTNSQCYHYAFCPRGGSKLHWQLRWGAMAGLAPPGSATAPKYLLDCLQSVFNAAARLLCNRRKYDHVTPLLRDVLHWLPVSLRVEFKICLLV